MGKNKSKGFWGKLFLPKSNSSCCNFQFEVITDTNDTSENKLNDKTEDKVNIENEQARTKKNENSCGCCNC